jgi:hypothetical protein
MPRNPPSAGGESVADKLAEVLIPPIPVRQGTPQLRLAVDLRNALQYDFTGASNAVSPTRRLDIAVSVVTIPLNIDPVTGRQPANPVPRLAKLAANDRKEVSLVRIVARREQDYCDLCEAPPIRLWR